MIFELIAIAAAVAILSAAASFVANSLWPHHTSGQLVSRMISWAVVGTFILMVAGCVMIQQTDCHPNDDVCDGPAMAAAGVVFLGVVLISMILFVGIPVIYASLKMLRRK